MKNFNKIYWSVLVLLALFFAPAAHGAICSGGVSSGLCDPTGAGSFNVFITYIFNSVGIILGILCVAMLVYSGVRMITSRGNEESVGRAKSAFQWTIIGFVIIISGFVIVTAIATFFGANNNSGGSNGPGINNPISSANIFDLSTSVFKNTLAVVGTLALLFIIIGGLRYLTARGNDEQAAEGKRTLTWAIVGLVIVILAYVIIAALAKLFPAG